MQINVSTRRPITTLKSATQAYVVALASAALTLTANAVPVDLRALTDGEFYASSNLLSVTRDWHYTGNLDAFDIGYVDTHIDECFWPCSDTKQTVTANRALSYTEGTQPNYSLTLQGEFKTDVHDEWNGNLVSHSKSGGHYGDHLDDDANTINRSGSETSGIAEGFRSAIGYQTPVGGYAEFSRNYALVADTFNPGSYGCPNLVPGTGMATGFCAFQEAWFAGSASLEANLQATGDISDNVFGLEQVTVQVSANRTTRFLANNSTLGVLANINTTTKDFVVSDSGQFTGFDFNLGGTVGIGPDGVTISAPNLVTAGWHPKDQIASFSTSYSEVAAMGRYESAGKASSYTVSVRDDPNSLAGIDGIDFTRALAYSRVGMSQLEATPKLVAKAFAGGNVQIDHAKLWGWSPRPSIPAGGFTEDRPLFLDLKLTNSGSLDVTLANMHFSLEEEDLFFGFTDDFLGAIDFTQHRIIKAGESLNIGLPMLISALALNNADDSLEGGYLELAGSGDISFSDIYGTRNKHFNATILPEPSHIFGLMLVAMLWTRRHVAKPRQRA